MSNVIQFRGITTLPIPVADIISDVPVEELTRVMVIGIQKNGHLYFQFLECALNLFLVDHSAEEAIERLRALADHIEEHS